MAKNPITIVVSVTDDVYEVIKLIASVIIIEILHFRSESNKGYGRVSVRLLQSAGANIWRHWVQSSL